MDIKKVAHKMDIKKAAFLLKLDDDDFINILEEIQTKAPTKSLDQ